MPRTYVPREWPYKAAEARDEAADHVAAALLNTLPVVEELNDPDQLRRLTRTVNHLQNALRFLENAGAKTRPASQ